MSKLFVVFGATGQQGGALVNYILNNTEFSKEFQLRGITRNASSPAAKELEKKGVEIVEVRHHWSTVDLGQLYIRQLLTFFS